MEVTIKTLKEMDQLGNVQVVKMPNKLREKYNVGVGDIVKFKSKTGNPIPLKVEQLNENNTAIDENSLFVSKTIFDLLDIYNLEDHTIKIVNDITLGCDPELFLINNENNEVVDAGGFFDKNTQVGYDGLLLELRPNPSVDEYVVTENIRNLLIKAKAHINSTSQNYIKKAFYPYRSGIRLEAHSCYDGLTAGFHLHYGLPKKLLECRPQVGTFIQKLVYVLDYYVGIPSIIPEKDDSTRRCAPYISYGKPGQYRLSFKTLEYRVPGGYLLRSPILSAGLIGLGALVVEDMISRVKTITNDFEDFSSVVVERNIKEIYPTLPLIEDIFKSICNKNIDEALKRIKIIYSDVTNMIGYEKRRTSVDNFFNVILNSVEFDSNVEKGWRI